MHKILFIDTEKSYLPEIPAYLKYFNNTSDFQAYTSTEICKPINYEEFDIIWEFKGLGGITPKNQLMVHEYHSLSTGNFAKTKDLLKKKINKKPDLRIFLNEKVQKNYNFGDETPYIYRDMGVDKSFFDIERTNKEYDFVYIGSVTKKRKIDKLLDAFVKRNNGKICLIGEPDKEIYEKFKNYKNITFTGRVSYDEVPVIASKGIYGINFIPDVYPYNIQTSTKVLEYLALGLKVVTTDYLWIREFEKENGCVFYYFNKNHLKIDLKEIENFNYLSNVHPEKFLWENVIQNSRISDIILKLL